MMPIDMRRVVGLMALVLGAGCHSAAPPAATPTSMPIAAAVSTQPSSPVSTPVSSPVSTPVSTPRTRELVDALRADPKDVQTLSELAFAYAMLGDPAAATAGFERAMKVGRNDPEEWYVYWSYGWASLNLGDDAKVLPSWQKAIALNRQAGHAPLWFEHHTLAVGYWLSGDRERALREYDLAAKALPEKFGSFEALTKWTGFWTARERQIIFPIFDAWKRGYKVEDSPGTLGYQTLEPR